MNTVSFHCTACGRCCNTPPAMTLSELLHHEQRFVGCLAIRRLPTYRVAERLPAAAESHTLTADDVAGIDELAARLLHTRHGRYAVGLQGLDYASLGACPARLDDGRCGIHQDRKPVTCTTVPLDPLFPDRLQHVVLMNRVGRGRAYLQADCITFGRRDGTPVLVDGGAIVDDGYRAALVGHRESLADDKSAWGDETFALLSADLFDDPVQARRIPSDGYLSLPLVPLLAVLSRRSAGLRERCRRYLRSQIDLIDAKVDAALQRRQAADKPLTHELRSFVLAYRRLDAALAAHGPGEGGDRP